MNAPDVNAVFDQVECPYAGYRRTLMTLKHYMDLAQEGEGEPLQIITKAVKPGGTYPGLNQLAQGGSKPEPQLDHVQDTP